jgi:hypothetical protein
LLPFANHAALLMNQCRHSGQTYRPRYLDEWQRLTHNKLSHPPPREQKSYSGTPACRSMSASALVSLPDVNGSLFTQQMLADSTQPTLGLRFFKHKIDVIAMTAA